MDWLWVCRCGGSRRVWVGRRRRSLVRSLLMAVWIATVPPRRVPLTLFLVAGLVRSLFT